MKKLLIIFLLFSKFIATAKPPGDSTRMLLMNARLLANPQKPFYNPGKSLSIYNKLATLGNGEAMNGLGIMYSKGLGITQNDQAALVWFEKAANSGYGNAYYNWATMVKNGVGTTQDFKKAYEIYKRGADQLFSSAMYGQGFMLYKGLGCTQNYDQAFKLFAKSANMNDKGAMYMKGLCYRNGYGITRNIDSARYWLNKAAKLGYQFAKDELATPEPENTNISNPIVLLPPSAGLHNPVPDIKSGYRKVKHRLNPDSIAGEYTGYALKFDWSGKHIIGESLLNLKLDVAGKTLHGNWTEDGTEYADLEARLADSAVIFNNTRYSRSDHYNTKTPNDFEFRNAQLQLVKSADTIYFTGNLQLYSTKMKEPEKPTFIMLIRNDGSQKANGNSNATANNSQFANSKTDSVKFIVYPNPFSNTLNAQFILKKACIVRLIISSLSDAHIVYQGTAAQFEPGEHTVTLHLNGSPGTYVCTLNYGNQLKSAIVFKQ
jgi:uncharacterized protein